MLRLAFPSLPAASLAYTVMVLLPELRLALKFQACVPIAFWRLPPFRLYCTALTPMLSLELPLTVRFALVTVVLLLGLAITTVGAATSLKVAFALFAVFIVTIQVPVPVQIPLQPTKLEPLAGVAVSVTIVPSTKSVTQVVPQLIPAGALLTVPVPEPVLVILKA